MFWTIVIFVVVLGLLVFVHELGHFLSAKRMGMRVDEFGFGFPPRLFGIKKGDTVYSINWIPLGGFVRIKGESGEDQQDEDSFAHKKPLQKVFVLAAGVLMNFALAFVLFTIGFMTGTPQEISDEAIQAGTVRDVRIVLAIVDENGPAGMAGLRVGDSLESINGVEFNDDEDVVKYIQDHNTEQLSLMIERGSEELEFEVTPMAYGEYNEPILGISMLRAGIVQHGFFQSIYKGAEATVTVTVLVIIAFFTLLVSLIGGTGVSDQISGPVGVAVLTGQVAQLGIPYLINFTAMLSINLGILNILPFPALDGGRILFVIIEKIKGHPVSQKIENMFHTTGFALLILLVIFVTYRDIVKYGEDILNGVKGLFS